MHQNKSQKNKTLFIVTIVIAGAFIGYSLFFTNGTADLALVLPQNTNQDQTTRELLVLFAELSSLNLNPAILSNPVFVSLEDFSRVIPVEPVGRTNPFIPI